MKETIVLPPIYTNDTSLIECLKIVARGPRAYIRLPSTALIGVRSFIIMPLARSVVEH